MVPGKLFIMEIPGWCPAEWGQANYSDKMNIHIKNLLESIPILTGLI